MIKIKVNKKRKKPEKPRKTPKKTRKKQLIQGLQNGFSKLEKSR